MAITLKANGAILFAPSHDTAVEQKPRYFLGDVASPHRNKISNGNMTISQRTGTTTFTHPGLGNDNSYRYFVADRFRVYAYTSGGNISNPITYVRNISTSSSETPDGHDSYARITFNNTLTTVGAADYVLIQTGIEGVDITDLHWGSSNAVPACLSFWARVSTNGIGNVFTISIRNSSSDKTYITPFVPYSGLANVWVKYYIPIPPCGDGTWLTGTGELGIAVTWTLVSGTNFRPSTIYEDMRWSSNNFLGVANTTNSFKTAGDTFDLTGVCFERAPDMNYCAHVLASSHLPSAIGNLGTAIASGDFDDQVWSITLPFNVTYFGQTSQTLYFSSNGYLSFLDSSASIFGIGTGPSSSNPSLGFFRTLNAGGGGGSTTDKRLKTLYGGSTTVTMEDGSSESIYHLRAVMYNFTGNSAVETIIEFRIYQNYTYEGYNVIDVHYIQNNNGDIVLEAIPGNPGTSSTNELFAYQVLQTNSSAKMFRVLTKAKTRVNVNSVSGAVASGILYPYWNNTPGVSTPGGKSNFSYAANLTDSSQYNLGVSDEAGTHDMGYEMTRCLRYYEKLWGSSNEDSGTNVNSSPSGNISTGAGIYPYFRSKSSGLSSDYLYCPFSYHEKSYAPSFTTYDTNSGARGYLSIDGTGGYASSVTWQSTNGGMVYWNSSGNFYGYTMYMEVYADFI